MHMHTKVHYSFRLIAPRIIIAVIFPHVQSARAQINYRDDMAYQNELPLRSGWKRRHRRMQDEWLG